MWDVHYPYYDALVITTRIANHNMHCILIDSGSSVNILSRVVYNQMDLLNDRLRPSLRHYMVF